MVYVGPRARAFIRAHAQYMNIDKYYDHYYTNMIALCARADNDLQSRESSTCRSLGLDLCSLGRLINWSRTSRVSTCLQQTRPAHAEAQCRSDVSDGVVSRLSQVCHNQWRMQKFPKGGSDTACAKRTRKSTPTSGYVAALARAPAHRVFFFFKHRMGKIPFQLQPNLGSLAIDRVKRSKMELY